MSTDTLVQPLPRGTGFVAAVSALAGVVLILAIVGAVSVFGDSGSKASPAHTFKGAGASFQIAVPKGWTALSGAALARTPGSPAAVLRRPDGRGVVIVRRTGALTGDLRTIARSLTARLGSRIGGFRLVGARVGHVRAGAAFLYTFVRGRTAQSLAVTRVKGVTYRIDTIVPAGSPDTAREAGAIVGSFGP